MDSGSLIVVQGLRKGAAHYRIGVLPLGSGEIFPRGGAIDNVA